MDEGAPDSLERGTPESSEGGDGRDRSAEAFFARLGRRLGSLWDEAGEGRSPPSSAPAAAELAPGTEVGPYRIVGRVGSGGMGTVYSARDPRLDRDVALKLLPPWLARDPRAAEHFRTEARAAAALDHPNICTIHEIGEDGEGRPYIAMALYRGETLKERLGHGPMPVGEAVQIAAAVARALAAAHARGIVHRDVKPGNVMLTEDGRVKLLDFGLARLEDATHTRPGLVRGTVSYMAPEQVQGERVGPGVDLWALGVVLYEMLAGERPFRGDRDRAVFRAILDVQPRPLAELRPGVPTAVAAVTRRLLRKDPADRYADAAEVLADLTGAPGGILAPTGRPSGSGSGRRLPALLRTGRRAALVAAGAVLVGLAALAAWRLHGAAGSALDDHLVAVLPFRVQSADPSFGYLHEGMMYMVAAKLEGTPDARAVEPDAVRAALQQVGGADEGGITPEMAVEVARRLHAGHALLASIASLPGQIALVANLYRASDGRAENENSISVEGTPDSLPSLTDRLVGDVMGLRAGEGKRLGSLTSESLSALRPYLKGMVAYRGGRFDEATRDFARAVQIDSTFALAALQAWLAASDGSARGRPGTAAYFGQAWRHRDRLAAREKQFVELLAGPNGPKGPWPVGRLLAARRELVRRQPDNPEAWYMLGIYIPGAESALGFPRSTAMADGARALRHAVSVDSVFLPAIWQLWSQAVAPADTAAMRRYASMFRAHSPTGMSAETLRCVETALDADRPSVRQIMTRADSVGGAVPERCVFLFHHLPMLAAVRDSAEDFLWRRYMRSLGKRDAFGGASLIHDFELDGGRPTHADTMARAIVQALHPDTLVTLTWRIRNTLWWQGEADEAPRWADVMADRLAADPPDSADTPASDALCVLGQWRLARGDTARASAVIRRLGALARDGEPSGRARARYCTRVLAAWRAAREGMADAEARLDSLAFNRGDDPRDGYLHREGYLVAASLLERRGDPEAALTALRHAVATMSPFYMSTVRRDLGRVAAEVGDTAEAIDAYRRYLALRTRPEPALAPEVEKVRKTLIALGG